MRSKIIVFGAFLMGAQLSYGQNKANPSLKKGLPIYDFTLKNFSQPSINFGPMCRWWWPGNLVEKTELKRELNLFADNGFAGVEVQPLNRRIPVKNEKDEARKLSWNTPDYYDNLRTVMQEARKRHLIVDVTNGSGWPPGGSFLKPEDGFISLEFGASTVTGGQKLAIPLVKPDNPTKVLPRLIAVVIAKQMTGQASGNNETVQLDTADMKEVTSYMLKDTLHYAFPNGIWKVIGFWAVRTGESTGMVASPKQGPILNHFDSLSVLKFYNHLYGDRTGLQPYFGNPMRAVFSDSYEFTANRFYAYDLPAYFKARRGYDLIPWLPANMQKGYNTVIFSRPDSKPDFSFSNQDWRLRYDYDLTLNDLLHDHFFKTSRNWAEKRDLLFRTQAYGFNMDMIAMAGAASIPETESMLGTEANLKIMTSGALLYNRPIVSAEAVVFAGRAYTNTPQKIRLAVDKLFAAGVNQIIYHGVPYRYVSDKFGPENWYLFSSPLGPHINFSSNLGEGNIFWKDQKRVNAYVSRAQYALRSGKPHADVLIYYPFLNIEGAPDNEEEILTTGYLKDVEGPLPPPKKYEIPDPVKIKWASKVYPLINQLEAAGLSWAWVNDESIQAAKLQKDNAIDIRGNLSAALILANDSTIQLKSTEKIKQLAARGMRLLVTGAIPVQQFSFLNWKENDQKTIQNISIALQMHNSQYLNDSEGIRNWISKLPRSIKYEKDYRFSRQTEREMTDGSRIKFIWNKSEKWQTISLSLDKPYTKSYWLNADAGTMYKNNGRSISWQLPPYGSVLLFASTNNHANQVSTTTPITVDPNKSILSIKKWNLKTNSVTIKNSELFDWRTNEQLKYSSETGLYTSTFQWPFNTSGRRFFLDLGHVSFTAEVYINAKFSGKVIYSPYVLDISKYLIKGTNTIEVRVTPGQLNGFIGKANDDDPRYLQFKGKNDQLMSAGLLGPVMIRPENKHH
jgi:hypothetical protein